VRDIEAGPGKEEEAQLGYGHIVVIAGNGVTTGQHAMWPC
jgi:hypothetical protein